MIPKKIFLVIPLVALLVLVLLYSHVEFAQNDYPNGTYLFEHSEQFQDAEICFRAIIYEINRSNQTILASLIDYPHSSVMILAQSVDPHLKEGDTIFVIGILTGKRTASANKILVKGLQDDDIIFISSIPAIPFVLYLFFRTWRFNIKTLSFERRQRHA